MYIYYPYQNFTFNIKRLIKQNNLCYKKQKRKFQNVQMHRRQDLREIIKPRLFLDNPIHPYLAKDRPYTAYTNSTTLSFLLPEKLYSRKVTISMKNLSLKEREQGKREGSARKTSTDRPRPHM